MVVAVGKQSLFRGGRYPGLTVTVNVGSLLRIFVEIKNQSNKSQIILT